MQQGANTYQQLYPILQRLFEYRNVIPALAIQTQKRLGMVKMRLYNGEMFQRSINNKVSYLMPVSLFVLLQ